MPSSFKNAQSWQSKIIVASTLQLTFLTVLCSDFLLIGQLGIESVSVQNFRACNFTALCPAML